MSVGGRRAIAGLAAWLAAGLLMLTSVSVVQAAHKKSSPLAGHWTGHMTATSKGSGFSGYNYAIVIYSGGRRGTWTLTANCHGPLVFIGLSHGFSRFRESLAAGATCLGNGIDQLKRSASGLFDSYQSHAGVKYDSTGTLHRARS
jgi:hypothetical protein